MKKVIYILLLTFLVSMPAVTKADWFDLGTKYNPVNVIIREDPLEKSLRDSQAGLDRLNGLRTQTDSTTYYTCQRTTGCDGTKDLGNPEISNTCYNQMSYCITQSRQAQQTVNSYNTTAGSDLLCKRTLGSNSGYNSATGKCACLANYVLSNNQCVTLDQYCHDQSGPNSSARITVLNEKFECVCSSEYIMSDGKCVQAPANNYVQRPNTAHNKPIVNNNNPAVANENMDANCKSLYGPNGVWNGGPYCECREGYWMDTGKMTCNKIKPKVDNKKKEVITAQATTTPKPEEPKIIHPVATNTKSQPVPGLLARIWSWFVH